MKSKLLSGSLVPAYLLSISCIGAGLVLLNLFREPGGFIRLDFGLIIMLAAALLANFPLRLLRSNITLIQAVTLGAGLLHGPALVSWAVPAGILLGIGIRHLWAQRPTRRQSVLLAAGAAIGMQIIPLTLALSVFRWESHAPINTGPIVLGQASGVALLFALLHSALFMAEFLLRGQPAANPALARDLVSVALVEVLPLPFVLIALTAFPDNPTGSLIALGGFPAILAVLMHAVSTARADLERRLLDLSTLNNISRALRSTLDMDDLLPVIQQQVTQLLGVDNFYVAMYDLNDQQLWYPLAVKGGQRRNWPRRPLTDRLTDRVIRERRPIMLARQAQQELARIGLPPSEDAPYAWLGVPLITAERAIGCLAVFSTSPNVEFASADLDLLTTLSGQVSVAIENALLYEQAQKRAAQLETLNRISTLITASLDLQAVLAQVCSSVTQVGGGQRSAIYLIDRESRQIRLAHAYGLSEDFVRQSQSISINQDARTRCLRTGRPALTPDLGALSKDDSFVELFERERIRAFGDFPLVTPEGQIGFLSVYFDLSHTFRPEQVELLQTFASQAALAVSNARLHERTDMELARRAQQLGMLENLAREMSAASHLERLFAMILDYALEFAACPWGNLSLYDPQTRTWEIKVSRGYPLSRTHYSDNQGIAGRVVRTRQPVNVGDVRADPDYLDLCDGAALSQLSVPMLHEDRVVGVLTVESPLPNAFSSNDQAFINLLSTQAAIAVVNAELYSETRRRLREQASLYQVSRRLVGNLNLDNVLQSIAQAIAASLESLATGIYLWDQNQQIYELRSTSKATAEAKVHLPAVLANHRGLERVPHQEVGTGSLPIVERPGNAAAGIPECENCQVLIFPLAIAEQRLGLVVSHLPAEQALHEEDLQLPRAMAAQGAIAIQNALLFTDVSQALDRLEAVLNSVAEGVLMVDAEGRVILGNASMQNTMGLRLKDITGKHLMELPQSALHALGFTSAQAENLSKNLGQSHRGPAPKATIRGLGEDRDKVFERFMAPVWGLGRRAIGWVFVVRDVTEEHQLNQAREVITETLVHDLRSPMGAISSALTLLQEALLKDPPDESAHQSLDIATRSTRRVMNLIESLLDISRLESGNIELELAPVDLHALATDLTAEFMPQATEFGVLLRNQVPEGLPAARADAEKIIRVISNLLDNALKFTPEGGQVTLSGEVLAGRQIAVRVSDTGPGIPPDQRDRIFERFSQVPGRRGRRRGSGLGLTFCRLAVVAHGGRIWVEPRPGGGSVFTFTLPRADSAPG